MPARNAEVTKAIIRYFVTLMPTDSAAMRLSRQAMIARPERLLIKLSTTNSVNNTSAKPTVKVDMRLTPRVPAGPLTTISPSTLGLSKAMCT